MGCAKNVVDSEKLMAQLQLSSIELTPNLEDAEIAVINTCGFIEAAKQESIDMIVETVRHKAGGRLKRVYAMGCLTERYLVELQRELPEVDRFFGSNQIDAVARSLGADFKHELLGERVLTTPGHYAYLKISEGCDNPCSFCAIPIMRGKHVSRPMEEIVVEAELLASRGVKELVVIGQDTTYYGFERYGSRKLPALLTALAGIPGIEWVRLMYAYPSKFPKEVLSVIAEHPHICNYIDMPVQHVSDRVLKSMRRGMTERSTRRLLESIRENIPGIALRTTLIVGYPREQVEDFEILLQFVEEMKFERLGVFTYSQEESTHSYALGDPLPQEEKDRRRNVIMELQQEIALERNQRVVGSQQRVLIDRREGESFIGRTEHDAPEIDNEVFVREHSLTEVGDFVDVEIVDASEYDLYGRVLTNGRRS